MAHSHHWHHGGGVREERNPIIVKLGGVFEDTPCCIKVVALTDDSNKMKQQTIKTNHMTEEERIKVVQGVIDRLLYLNDSDRQEFLKYVDALFSMYKHDRHTKWGVEVFTNQNQDDENREDSL